MRLGITDYDKINENTFGAEPKTWIRSNGLKYLVKSPKFTKGSPTDSVKFEHLASSFINLAGGESTQDYIRRRILKRRWYCF